MIETSRSYLQIIDTDTITTWCLCTKRHSVFPCQQDPSFGPQIFSIVDTSLACAGYEVLNILGDRVVPFAGVHKIFRSCGVAHPASLSRSNKK